MAASQKLVRCAIYTRKSTEHGLELEFNSLHAQREACAAYIRSQASQGWKLLPQHYDDPAYSGGNLDRPALKSLLQDIDASKVDVVVVYKIDRLTRSLADFAKLVEAFDAKSISFVAVTQQFNTTSSMGRLTLNVLLSFAQFERELSSERVRDKVAASRAKGKWMGGSIPLGYDVKDKKLVPNPAEQKIVRFIFARYLELKSLSKLLDDLNAKRISTKRRAARTTAAQGGSRFTYGTLAYMLRNRIYVGEAGHRGKWYPGEHEPILDRRLFDDVQAQFTITVGTRAKRRSESGALLMGKLFDDRGNAMTPSYSTKNGVRYRFYVSSALLKGRKTNVGSVGRVSASEIEGVVARVLSAEEANDPIKSTPLSDLIERITVSRDKLLVTRSTTTARSKAQRKPIVIDWSPPIKSGPVRSHDPDALAAAGDDRLLQSVVRARAWIEALTTGKFESVETMAAAYTLHPKLVRRQMRFAFLDPRAVEAACAGDAANIRVAKFDVPLRWRTPGSRPGSVAFGLRSRTDGRSE
jgi:DNA invertase Pin-like site-specific DNA recombinase